MFSTLESSLSAGPDWALSLLLGAIIVAVYAYSRFDEPSYGKLEYFSHYEPRFYTSHTSYQHTKYAFTALITLLFVMFATAIQWVRHEVGDGKGPLPFEGLSSPIAIAVYIYSISRLPVLEAGERIIRGILQARAKIPQAVRQTFDQIDRPDFNSKKINEEKRRICETSGESIEFVNNRYQDDVVYIWLKMSSLIHSLSERRHSLKVEGNDFFVRYREEFDDIKSQHEALFGSLQRLCSHGKSTTSQDKEVKDLFVHLDKLEKRLLTFIACFVRSSVATDDESDSILSLLRNSHSPDSIEQIDSGSGDGTA